MRGQVIYLYAYDVAYEINLQKVRELLKEPSNFLQTRSDKTIPRDFPFYKPLSFGKSPIVFQFRGRAIKLYPEVKLFSFGAISISYWLEFEVPNLSQLLEYHSLVFEDGKTMDEIANNLCEQVRSDIEPHLIKATSKIGNPEAYTIFWIKDAEHGTPSIQEWLKVHQREIAGLLTEEVNFEKLSDNEVNETIRINYSYTIQDAFIVDWNSTLIIDIEEKPEELLYIVEVANLQLTELRHYDQFLEIFLDRAYDDIEAYSKNLPFLRGPGRMLRKLKEMRMDLTKMSGELSNITKFFGDWHLARIYMACKERFHLKEWEESVEGMLKTLDSLYNLVLTDINNRRLVLMEGAIVFLFVLDILFLLFNVR
jgi:small nuclear ribonucleoprotein (snRNP)-like protein